MDRKDGLSHKISATFQHHKNSVECFVWGYLPLVRGCQQSCKQWLGDGVCAFANLCLHL